MSIPAAIDEKQGELMQVARLLGENLSRRAFGEHGPDLKVTLVDLEQFLRPIVAAVAEGFLAVSAQEQTQRLSETLPCPTCGRACSRSEHKRTLRGELGAFTWSEPACYCERCERSFFPSTDHPEG
jgi:NADH pyrophosphatase NudC (nudix superfamily)